MIQFLYYQFKSVYFISPRQENIQGSYRYYMQRINNKKCYKRKRMKHMYGGWAKRITNNCLFQEL